MVQIVAHSQKMVHFRNRREAESFKFKIRPRQAGWVPNFSLQALQDSLTRLCFQAIVSTQLPTAATEGKASHGVANFSGPLKMTMSDGDGHPANNNSKLMIHATHGKADSIRNRDSGL